MTALEGKAMLLPLLRGDALAGDVRRAVEKIEAEATAAAEQRLRDVETALRRLDHIARVDPLNDRRNLDHGGVG